MAGQSFGYIGSQATYVVPAGVTRIVVNCWGAQGQTASDTPTSGLGGYVSAIIPVTPGETLYVNVGGRSGFNGGGGTNIPGARGGGGMSDVRRGGTGTANIVVVAGGGGGGSWGGAGGFSEGAAGGATWGGNGGGGTQTSGGAAGGGGGATAGSAFQGGTGVNWGGGGGGGYFGGGGSDSLGFGSNGGGGGSSWWAATAFGVVWANTVQYGDGAVVIAMASPPAPILNAPVSGANLNAATNVTLAWTYQQSGAGTTQTSWQGRRRIGAGAYSYWSVVAGNWSSSTPINNTGAAQSAVTTGWTNGNTYLWAVASADSNGIGNYPIDSVFTAVAAPTVSVTAPTGTATTDPVAHIAWTPTTPGGSQTTYQAIVYTAAQYGAGGFTPGVGPSAWDSGVVGGSAVAATSTPLGNATYRAYVQVTQTGGQVSAWAYSAFTINCTPPATPTLTATLDSPNAQTVLVVTAAVTALTATIQYSDDGGTTWQLVRFATGLAMPGKVATDYDLEAVQGGTRQYRAQVVTALGVPSAWSTVQSVTNTTGGLWLRDPLQIIPTVKLSVVPASLTTAFPEPLTEHHTLGRADAIIVADVIGLESGSITVFTMSATDDAALMALLLSQRTLLLQSPDHRAWYCRVVSPRPTDVPYVLYPGSYRTHAINFTGQPRPA